METMLVRLKPHDPRRGCVLRRYTYRGIKFHDERGWYRVEKPVADYLRAVGQVAQDEHSPLAFDVCSEAEARAIDEKDREGAIPRSSATDKIKVSVPRSDGAVTTRDLPDAQKASTGDAKGPSRKGSRR
jgi:hypothetical protein